MKTLHNNFIGTQAEIEAIDAFEGMIAYATDLNLLGTFNGDNWDWFSGGSIIGAEDYIVVRDKKASGTDGGTFTQDAWQTRDINEELVDTGGYCSVSSNQITLEAGTYRCRICAPAYSVKKHQAKLYNVTSGSNVLVGTSVYVYDADYGSVVPSRIEGEFSLSTSSILEVRHYCSQTKATNGFGVNCNFGLDEIYTVAEFWRRRDYAGDDAPSAKVYRSTNQTINNTIWTSIEFDVEDYDTDNIWISGSSTRLTCKTAGKYIITGHISWDSNATGYRGIAIVLNDSIFIAAHRNLPATGVYTPQTVAIIYDLDVDDYVELRAHQSCGTTLDIAASSEATPTLAMSRIGGGESELDLVANGRLTLTSGSPVTTSDVTAATSVYFTPYLGNRISLYNGASWKIHQFTERTLSLSGFAADTNFDIFLYNNSGTLTLEAVAWSGSAIRATALAVQDGVYVKSGDSTRRYLGTIRTTGTIGQCEDSGTKRFVANYYNKVPRNLNIPAPSGSWTYSSGTWRVLNNDSNLTAHIVIPVSGEIKVHLVAKVCTTTTSAGRISVGKDGSELSSRGRMTIGDWWDWATVIVHNDDIPSAGYHYYQPGESATTSLSLQYSEVGSWLYATLDL